MSGSVRQEDNGSFTFQFWYRQPDTGKRVNVKRRGFSTKKDAAAAMRRLQVSFEELGPESGSKLTLAQYLETWFSEQRVGKAPATNDRYRNAIDKHLVPGLGGLPLKKLSVLRVEKFLNSKLEAGLAEETVNGFYRVLNTAMKDAVRWGYLSTNPISRVSPPRRRHGEVQVMTLEEQGSVARLLDKECDGQSIFLRRNGALSAHMNRILFHLIAATGMRRGEAGALRFGDINDQERTIALRRSVSTKDGKPFVKSPKTQRSLRVVEVDEGLLLRLAKYRSLLAEHRELLGPGWNQEGWLFVSSSGALLPPRALNSRFSGVLERAGLGDRGYGLHTLRHTHISQLLMRNVPPLVVSRRAGHASVATTMNLYGHVISQMADGMVASHLSAIRESWS